MGAFKFRGAFNALSQLQTTRKSVAWSRSPPATMRRRSRSPGKLLGIKTVIVMPHDAPKVKLDATRGYGAEVVQYIKHEDRETLATKLAAERGLTLIPPFDHPHIIAGQGTAAKELIEDAGALDLLLVPCGGGGLLSGSSIAAKHLAPECRVIGVEPAAGDDATQSFLKKRLVTIAVPDTIADGARTPSLGKLTFPIVLRYVDDMLTVTDAELTRAMFFLWERMKILVEPTGALGACALFTEKIRSEEPACRRDPVRRKRRPALGGRADKQSARIALAEQRRRERDVEARRNRGDGAAEQQEAQRPGNAAQSQVALHRERGEGAHRDREHQAFEDVERAALHVQPGLNRK